MSLVYPWLITGIPMVRMETHRSESLMITGLHRSGCMIWVLRVPATGTCQTVVFLYFIFCVVKIMYINKLKIKLN